MGNKLIAFPQDKHVEALAYVAACDGHYASNFEPGGKFGYIRLDALGEWVTPFYGPPWQFIECQEFAEPDECASLRVDGDLRDAVIWSQDE